jgi:hypothetical protein
MLLLVIGVIAGGGSGDGDDPEPTATTVAQVAPTQALEPTAAPTSIYAVDEVAKEFSDWGDGGQTDAGFSINDDGAQEARACSEAAGE